MFEKKLRMNKAKIILSDVFDIDVDDIPDNAQLGSFPEWDSLGHMRLIIELEKSIARPILTEEVLSITNLKNISKLIEK